jgi:hypothetical protein
VINCRFWRGLTGLIVLVVLLVGGGCSQQAQARDDLVHALAEAHSALGSTSLALDLLAESRITRAAAETAVDDMSQQISDAQHQLEPIRVDSDAQQADRDAAVRAVAAGFEALLLTRDQLRQGQSTTDARSALAQADQEVAALSTRLQAGG